LQSYCTNKKGAIFYASQCSCTIAGVRDYDYGVIYELFIVLWILFGLASLAELIRIVQASLSSLASTVESKLLPRVASQANDDEVCIVIRQLELSYMLHLLHFKVWQSSSYSSTGAI